MTPPMTGEEDHRGGAETAHAVRVGRLAEGCPHLDPSGALEPLQLVETAAPDDPDDDTLALVSRDRLRAHSPASSSTAYVRRASAPETLTRAKRRASVSGPSRRTST